MLFPALAQRPRGILELGVAREPLDELLGRLVRVEVHEVVFERLLEQQS